MNNDDIENEGSEENEESKINPIQENNHNYSNREISSGQLNQRSEGGNVNNRIEGSNHDLPSREQLADQRNRINNNDGKNGCNNSEGSNEHGYGNNGGDGPNKINNEDNSFVTRREFIREIRRIDSSINGINTRLDDMNRNIQLLIQNQNHQKPS